MQSFPATTRQKHSALLPSLVAAAMVTACMQESLTDVSQQPKYQHLIATEFEVVGRLDAYGIRDHSQAPVKYVTLMPPPGIEGSQIAYVREVPVGSTVRVAAVMKSNRLIDPDMTLFVEVSGSNVSYGVPVRIDLFRGNESKGKTGLNPQVFRQRQ